MPQPSIVVSNSTANARTDTARKNTLQITGKKLSKERASADLQEATLDQQIATAAYYLAQQRNFAPGNELNDWFAAERQVRGLDS